MESPVERTLGDAPETRLLALHAGSLGDCVLAIHLINSLQRLWNTRATLIARSGIATWAKQRGIIDDAVSIDAAPPRFLFDDRLEIPHEIKRYFEDFERVLSFLGDPTRTVARRIHYIAGERAFHIAPRAKTNSPDITTHITAQWAAQLSLQGLTVPTVEPVTVSNTQTELSEHRNKLAQRLGSRGPLVLIHPGSGGLKKCVPLEHLENVACRLAREVRGAVGWIIGPDERERFGQEYINKLLNSGAVIYEESIELAADLVCGADLYLGHDAGMTHVAALAGVPTIAIFGPTDPRVWRPLGTDCRVFSFPIDDGRSTWANNLVKLSIEMLQRRQSSNLR